LKESFRDVDLSDVVQPFTNQGFAVQVGHAKMEIFRLEIPLNGFVEANPAASVPFGTAEGFGDLVDHHVIGGGDGAFAVCIEDRIAPKILQSLYFPVEQHGIHHKEGAQECGQSGEGSRPGVPENMPPAVAKLDSMARLGTAVEAYDESFRVGGRKIIGHQAFSLVSVVCADHDFDFFHGIGLLPGGVPQADTPPHTGILLQPTASLLTDISVILSHNPYRIMLRQQAELLLSNMPQNL